MPELSCVIRLHPRDNVVVARRDLGAGEPVPEEKITSLESVPAGHKIATMPIPKGSPVRKYDQVIGRATCHIQAGAYVHTHNLCAGDFQKDYAPGSRCRPTEFVPSRQRAVFHGILRKSGKVATRNYIGVLCTVNCSATVSKAIAETFKGEEHPGVDGIVALVHGEGCAMGGTGEQFEAFQGYLGVTWRIPIFSGCSWWAWAAR